MVANTVMADIIKGIASKMIGKGIASSILDLMVNLRAIDLILIRRKAKVSARVVKDILNLKNGVSETIVVVCLWTSLECPHRPLKARSRM